ncbi:MAG: nitrogenase component 1 [Fastidiosipilaceae bacterium]|jgi:nitrogenase iron protein NifH|nr:nitrogen fixation protein NifEH [Clostridiaceae bacterium]
MEIAIYGKGGIGKSTISANLSFAWATGGLNVMQVGCDPKHDSCKALLGGIDVETVLDYMRRKGPAEYQLEDLVHIGAAGIHCVEAGGPEPGVGCAGRGILSTFELLDQLGLDRSYFDVVLYDVLGDVVCGGFAVPLRKDYAERVYLVTSGEFMSLYAANNILRGLSNYASVGPRAGGIILNARGLTDEFERVERFAEAVGLPILIRIPRDSLFAQAEKEGVCVAAAYPDSPVARAFTELSQIIWQQTDLYPANPLSDDELETCVLGKTRVKTKSLPTVSLPKTEKVEDQFLSKSLLMREPLHGCAYNGAMNLAVQIRDSITISHGPRSCANLSLQSISSLGRRSLLEKSIVLPVQLRPNILSSEMDETAMVFGGGEALLETVLKAAQFEPELIIVVTTCPAGIIADDVEKILDTYIKKEKHDIPVVILPTDGNLNGDYMQGMMLCYREVARQLVQRNNLPDPDPFLVNIYGEKSIANSTSDNIRLLETWLAAFGAKLHCRYLNDTTKASVQTLLHAGLHINAYDDYMGKFLKEFFLNEFDIEFFPVAFPIGTDQTITFINALGEFFDQPQVAAQLIEIEKTAYEAEMAAVRPILQGKRLMVVSYNHELDWILRTALDAGMEIVKVGLINFSQDVYSESPYREYVGEWEVDYSQEKRLADVKRLRPDLLLGNYNTAETIPGVIFDTIQLSPAGGSDSGRRLARRWVQLFRQDIQEGWRDDVRLFDENFAR